MTNVVAVGATGDQSRMPVVHAVPNTARVIVLGIAGHQQGAVELLSQFPDSRFFKLDFSPIE